MLVKDNKAKPGSAVCLNPSGLLETGPLNSFTDKTKPLF